jgi:hypothetical protein
MYLNGVRQIFVEFTGNELTLHKTGEMSPVEEALAHSEVSTDVLSLGAFWRLWSTLSSSKMVFGVFGCTTTLSLSPRQILGTIATDLS